MQLNGSGEKCLNKLKRSGSSFTALGDIQDEYLRYKKCSKN